jgi:hypothetical protein
MCFLLFLIATGVLDNQIFQFIILSEFNDINSSKRLLESPYNAGVSNKLLEIRLCKIYL